MKDLLNDIRKCKVCADFLPNGPKPIVQASVSRRIVIIGQAPGSKVHQSGIPWDDASGSNLRNWLGVSNEIFYDEKLIALVPMGFCFPGSGSSGDLAPRTECAPLWHSLLLQSMTEVKLTLLVGQYAQKYYLGDRCKLTLTETVENYPDYLPNYLPLPHPSPRNNIWQKKNSWFADKMIPLLHEKVEEIIQDIS
jgi:uracil-DNA glycosylase